NPMNVGSSAIAVAAGGVPAPGTIGVSSDRMTLTFIPRGVLLGNTTYTVTASGFTDQAGNQVMPFTSSFTTSASGAGNTTAPAVVSVNPSDGATGVGVNSNIVLTFNEALNALSINTTSVPISASGVSGLLAGSYTLDATGKVVTFTPASPLPPNTTVQ